jgi:cytoskeletal protein CcmA (bactofilin family)
MWNRESKPSTPAPITPAAPVTLHEPSVQAPPVQAASAASAAAAIPMKARGSTLVIKGDVTAAEDLVVEGRVEGSISLPDHVLTIGAGSDLAAAVNARVVVLQGAIAGDINAFERVELKSTGRMNGDLVTPKVQMSDGATFTGRLETRKPGKTGGHQGQKGAERVA